MASITDFIPSAASQPSKDGMQRTIPLDSGNTTLRAAAEDCERRVQALLARKPETKLLAAVQEQVKIATRVIDEALEKYR